MIYRPALHTIERIGTSDAWCVTQPSVGGPPSGAIVLHCATDAVAIYANIFDAIRAEVVKSAGKVAGVADVVQKAMDPRVKEKLKPAPVSRTSNVRPVTGPSGPVGDAACVARERARDAEFRSAAPWASDILVDLLRESRRSLRVIARCDEAVNFLTKDPFLNGSRVTEKKRRGTATSLTVLRADISGLETQPYLRFRQTVEDSVESAAKAVMANLPAEAVRLRDLLRQCVAVQRAVHAMSLERLRCELSAMYETKADTTDHDRLVLLSSTVSMVMANGGVRPLKQQVVVARLHMAAKAGQYLDHAGAAKALGEACDTLL